MRFLTNQIQLVANLQPDQIQFICFTVTRLAATFSQLVMDTEFAFKNARRDFAVEDRYERTKEFKEAVVECRNSAKFIVNSVDGPVAIKISNMLLELGKLNW